MSRARDRRRQQPPRDERYWQQIIENRLPLVGGWFREVAVQRLAQSARQGVPSAAQSLADALDTSPDDAVREVARQALLELNGTAALNAVWAVWAAKRPTPLQDLLLERGRPATAPFSLRLLSLLLLEQSARAEPLDHADLPDLLRACQDRDPEIAGRARDMLAGLTDAESIDALCAAWYSQRLPFLEAVLAEAAFEPAQVLLQVMVRLKRGQLEEVASSGAEVVAPLLRACRDQDRSLARAASVCLLRLTDLDARDELVRIWSQTREQPAEQAVLRNGWVARQPAEARLLRALKVGDLNTAALVSPAELHILTAALNDRDDQISASAGIALSELASQDSQVALCQAVIADGDPQLAGIAVNAGYSPALPEEQALFAFLTGQYDRYAALDFDQRMLQAVYSAGDPRLRQRISQAIQSSGRAEFLSILTGGLARPDAATFSPQEAELYARLLSDSSQWERLWSFAQQLPIDSLLRAVTRLAGAGWSPAGEDRQLFLALEEAAAEASEAGMGAQLQDPPAVKAATIRVRGRVNSLAFAPDRPVLAIGTGQRVVVLFDYARGSVLEMVSGFDHSIARVAFSLSGRLFCAERANPDAACGIYEISGGRPERIGCAAGSVLDICPAPDGLLISLSRDRRLSCWDPDARSEVQHAVLPAAAGLPRELLLSPEHNRLALLYRHISFLNYPGLSGYSEFYRTFNRSTHLSKSVARSGAWLDGDGHLAVGQGNGQVVEYRSASGGSYREKRCLHQHDRSAVAIAWLKHHQQLISAGAEGDICFYPAPDWQPVQAISTPCQSLTAMLVSPDEQLMAVGTSDNRLLVYDLRARRIPELLEQPIGSLSLANLALVRSQLAADGLQPSTMIRLSALQAALAHRFRYEIQVDHQPLVQPGDYDIQLAETQSESG